MIFEQEPLIFDKLNDNVIEIKGLKSAITNIYNSSAVLTATLHNQAGDIVPEVDGVVLEYVPSSNGKFRGFVEDTFDPPAGTSYTMHLRMVDGATVNNVYLKSIVRVRDS